MRPLPLAAILTLALVAPGLAQGAKDETRRREVALQRYQAYLARKPFHAWAFDKLVEAAVGLDRLEALVKEYEGLESPGLAQQIVLSRLYARVDRTEDALKLLGGLETPAKPLPKRQRAAWLALRGGLRLHAGQPKLALALLDQAAQAAGAMRDQTLIERLHRQRGEAALAAGERTRAVEAFRALAALAPKSLSARLEVARLLAENGLVDEALVDLAAAKTLAGQDSAQRCRVLGEVGRLQERRLRIPAALTAYREAIDLMQRGNWLLRELRARVLAIHRRTGQLEVLAKQTRVEIVKKLGQLEPREFLAEVLEAAGHPKQARDLLEGAIEDFPSDLALGRRLLVVLERLDDAEGRVREYQRLLGHHPDELDLYVELGQTFAKSGRLAQALRQWKETLKKRLTDPALCRRLSELYARYDQLSDAIELSQRALELAPGDTALVGELARLLTRAKRVAEIEPLLAATAKRIGREPTARRALASLYEAHRKPDLALALIRDLPAEPGVLAQRVRLHLILEQPALALAAQRLLVGVASDPASRERAATAFLRLARKTSTLAAELGRAERELGAKSKELAPYLILARAAYQSRDTARTEQVLEDLLVVRPGQVDAHRSLAKLAERRGDVAAALRHQRALLKTRGTPPRRALLAMARLHLTRYERDAALDAYRKVLAASPGNPAAFQEVAKEYETLGLTSEARRCLRQAVRLSPDDGKLRLELARVLERLGERGKARVEILAATRCKDRRQRKKARQAYYRSLVGEGALEAEVASLRRRCEDNPYDIEAPLTLVDLYVRELEYEPALELIERLLSYQPRQAKLLAERARLCRLLERHEEAIATYESLWRLPDQDRKRLALDMADAALARGDLPRAEKALAGAASPTRVARLYERHNLPERALAAIQAGLKTSPQNARLHRRLARLLTERGDRAAAALSLERWLELRGERFPQLVELGALYHQLGNKDLALRCGQRLLAILRQKAPRRDEEDEEDDEHDPEKQRQRRWRAERRRAVRGQLRDRIRETQAYFTNNGLGKEFPATARAEWRLAPDNDLLLDAIVQRAQGPEAAKVALGVLSEATASKRQPRSYTPTGWKNHLAQLKRSLLERETAARKERTADLQSRLASLKPAEGTLLLSLLDAARRSDELDSALEALLQRSPQETRYRLARAERAEARGEPAAAIPDLQAALLALNAPERLGVLRGETTRRQALDLAQRHTQLREAWPLRARASVRGPALARLAALSHDPWRRGKKTSWRAGQEPSPLGVASALARCAAAAKRPALAKSALDTLRPRAGDPLHPNSLRRWARLAVAYFERDLPSEGAAICETLLERERALERDPIMGLTRRWASNLDAPLRRWAQELARQGEHLRAYDLYRTYGEAGAARLLLEENKLLPKARQQAEEALGAAEQALEAKEPGASERLHRAAVRLGELAQWAKDWDAAAAAFERGSRALPLAWDLYHSRARLHLRADRPDAAVAIYEEAIERKRVARRRPEAPRPRGRILAPLEPEGLAQAQHWAFSNLKWAVRSGDQTSPRAEHVAVLRIHLERRRADRAAAALRQLAREDVDTFRWIAYSLGRLIRDARLGPAGLPILKLLWEHDNTDAWLGLDVAESLLAGGQPEEAARILRRARTQANSWLQDRARSLGERIERRLGRGGATALAELEAAVAAAPKEAKPRLPLIRRLVALRRYPDALREARRLVKLAPHQLDGRRLLGRLLIVAGDEAGVVEHQRGELRRAKDQEERFQIALRIATLVERPGPETPELKAALREAAAAAGSPPRYSLANWHFARGRDAAGLAALKKVREEQPRGQWIWREATERLLEVYGRLGRGEAFWALARELVEQQGSVAGRNASFDQIVTSLRAAGGGVDAPDRSAFLRGAAKLPAPWPTLARLAVAISVRDLKLAEATLLEALASEDELVAFLRPLAVQLAEARGDTAEALKRLEAILAGGGLNGTVQTPVGALSERRLGDAVAGRMLLDLGRETDALTRWRKVIVPGDPASRLPYARLLALHERYDEACAALREHLAREGPKNPEILRWLASWEERRGQPAAARVALGRAATLATGRSAERWNDVRGAVAGELLAHHRRAGTLEPYRVELAARWAKDPDDVGTAGSLIELLAEMERDADLEQILERLTLVPAKAPGALRLLASIQQRSGRLKEAAATLAKVPPGQQNDYAPRRAGRIAALLWRTGAPKRALAALRKGYDDPTGEAALASERRFLEDRQEWTGALRAHDQGQLGRVPPGGESIRARLLESAGHPREALEALWRELEHADNAGDQDGLAPRLLRLERLASLAPKASLAPLVSGSVASIRSELALPAALRAGFREAVLHRAHGRLEPAAKAFAELRERFGDHLPTLWGELEVLLRLERHAEVEARLEDLFPRLQRLAAASCGSDNLLREAWRLRGALRIAAGDEQGALAKWREPESGRYATLDSYNYSIWSQIQDPIRPDFLEAHGLLERSLKGPRRRQLPRRLRTLIRLGRVDQARELARRASFDALQGTVSDVGLFLTARASGELAEVTSAVMSHWKKRPEPSSRRLVLSALNDDPRAALAFLHTSRVPGQEHARDERARELELLVRLGRFKEALPFARRHLLAERAAASRLSAGGGRLQYGGAQRARIRFQWGGAGGSSSYMYWSSGRSGNLAGERRAEARLLGLLARAGEHQERLERQARWLASAEDLPDALDTLARAYAGEGALRSAIAIAEQANRLRPLGAPDLWLELLRAAATLRVGPDGVSVSPASKETLKRVLSATLASSVPEAKRDPHAADRTRAAALKLAWHVATPTQQALGRASAARLVSRASPDPSDCVVAAWLEIASLRLPTARKHLERARSLSYLAGDGEPTGWRAAWALAQESEQGTAIRIALALNSRGWEAGQLHAALASHKRR